MADSSWLSECYHDPVTFRGVFGRIPDFPGLQVPLRRRREARLQVIICCVISSAALLVPTTIALLLAIQLHVPADSRLAVTCYVLSTLSASILYVIWRSLVACRATECLYDYYPEVPGPAIIDEESALLSTPPPSPQPPPPPPAPPLVCPAPVRPLSTTARPILVRPCGQAPPTAAGAGRRSPPGSEK